MATSPLAFARGLSTPEAVAAVREFAERGLPLINRAARDGELPLEGWTRRVAPVVAAARAVLPDAAPEARARIRFVLGMIALSSERHAQPLGYAPGEIYRSLPHLAETLLAATRPGHRPALNHHDYWITNTGPRVLSFTGEAHELFFISSVQTQTYLRSFANGSLRPILTGLIPVGSSHAVRLLNTAASALDQGHQQYHDFKRGPMDAAAFNEMRVWLPHTELAGTDYGGPNAAYIGEMATTDTLVGTADEHYRDYLNGFLHNVEPHERELITTDLATPSITTVLASAMGLGDEHDLANAPTSAVARILADDPSLRDSAVAARAAYRAFCGTSGAHYGHIHTKLVKYAETLTPEERAALPVNPAAGVGGNSHQHTKELHDTRRTAPAWRTLIAALALLDASDPTVLGDGDHQQGEAA